MALETTQLNMNHISEIKINSVQDGIEQLDQLIQEELAFYRNLRKKIELKN